MKISIITASYNYENYIKETIESVIEQTYQDWEMIVVDDGSSDNSLAVIDSYCKKDSRIKLFTHENNINKGLKDTLLLGLEKAQGDWVVFLESDDYISPDYLEKKLSVIEKHPDVNIIINDVNLLGEHSKTLTKHFKQINKALKKDNQPVDLSRPLMKKNHIVTFSIVMMKKILLENIDFECPIKPLLDYYIWAQIARNNKFYYIDEKLTTWRIHNDSYIKNARTCNEDSYLNFNLKKAEFIYKNKNNLMYLFYILAYRYKFYRKTIMKVHFKEKSISFLGRQLKW